MGVSFPVLIRRANLSVTLTVLVILKFQKFYNCLKIKTNRLDKIRKEEGIRSKQKLIPFLKLLGIKTL